MKSATELALEDAKKKIADAPISVEVRTAMNAIVDAVESVYAAVRKGGERLEFAGRASTD